MPEPRVPQYGGETQQSAAPKPGANVDQDARRHNQSKPADREPHADFGERLQDKEDHQGDRDALENEMEHRDRAGKEQPDKQAGQMLERPGR